MGVLQRDQQARAAPDVLRPGPVQDLRRDPRQRHRQQGARSDHGHPPRGHRPGSRLHPRVQRRQRHPGRDAQGRGRLRPRAHLRTPTHIVQLQRRREEGHRRPKRIRSQGEFIFISVLAVRLTSCVTLTAREHLLHRVRGGDVRREPPAPIPPGVQEQHGREVRAGGDQVQAHRQLDLHHFQARPRQV